MEQRLFNVKELSAYLGGVSINTIYCWVSQRKLPYKKLGKLVRFEISEIDKWIDENTKPQLNRDTKNNIKKCISPTENLSKKLLTNQENDGIIPPEGNSKNGNCLV